MNNKPLFDKITIDAILRLYFERKYKARIGLHFLNIFGVRAATGFTNTFDDVIGAFYRNENDIWVIEKFDGTTEPGKFWMEHPIDPKKGTGIIAPGWYPEVYETGLHQGKERALVQRGPMKCYRDNDRDLVYDYDPDTIEEGRFGANLHNANDLQKSTFNDKWSAMCQVMPDPNEHKRMMELADKHESIYRQRMDYGLLEEKDF